MSNSGVSWRHGAGTALVVLLASYAVLRFTTSRGSGLPHMSWFILVTIVLLSVAVLAAGWEVRAYLRGESTRPPTPQRARRALVAAQSWVLAGGVSAGWFGAFALIEWGRLDAQSAFGNLILGIVLCLASIGAMVVGLVVQDWCRLPDDQDEDRHGGGPLRS